MPDNAFSALRGRLGAIWLLLMLIPVTLAGGRIFVWGHDEVADAMLRKVDAVLLNNREIIEASLDFGIPLDRIRGAQKQFQAVLSADQSIRAVAIIGPSGRVLFAGGLPAEIIADRWKHGGSSTSGDLPANVRLSGGIALSSISLRAGSSVAGSLVILSSTDGLDLRLLQASIEPAGVALLVLALGLALVWYCHRLFWHQPLEAVSTLLADGAEGRFETTPLLGAGDEFFRLEQLIRSCGLTVEDRLRLVWEIAEEVRSVTPEPEIASEVGRLMIESRVALGPALVDSALAHGLPASALPPTHKGQSLREHVTLLVAASLVLLGLVGVFIAYRLETLIDHAGDQQYGAVLSADLRTTFERAGSVIESETRHAVADDLALLDATARHDQSSIGMELTAALETLGPRSSVDSAQLFDLDGQLLNSSAVGLEGSDPPLLSSYTVLTILRSGQTIKGLTLGSHRRLLIVRAIPVERRGIKIGVVAATSSADNLLAELADTLQSQLVVVDPNGKILSGDPAVWQRLVGSVSLTNGGIGRIKLGDHTLTVTSVGLSDLRGGRLGYVVATRDVSAETIVDQAGFEELIAPTLLAVLVIFGAVALYLRSIFGPLNDSVAALKALASGATMVLVKVPPEDDEVGRISRAVHVFRDTAIALQRADAERARRRRRQERVIRRQMMKLAETLNEEARQSILDDLAQMESGAAAPGPGGVMAAEFDALVVAFRQMTERVSEQHDQLTLMVEQLREALKTKTAFMTLQQELGIAAELQASILPKVFPVRGDLQIHALMKPAKEVGGDFYDVFEWADGKVGIVVADVSGKGVPAALFMAISRTLLKATALFVDSPGDCLRQLNDLLVQDNEKMLFVTTFYGIFDPVTGAFIYANGGHNPPYHMSWRGEVTALPSTEGIALAVMPDFVFREHTIMLEPGDAIVMFTDGVTEAESPYAEQFGDPRLIELLKGCTQLTARELADEIVRRVHQFADVAPQADDITCLIMRYGTQGVAGG